ncbi:MAG TPA: DUF951 domain-containing protein [Clostridia bacterium]|jgi:hypothetical protein|nr:DUF951 domain-containing protein [Clostridia bacterium]HOM34974.1 DUF951 domain-containing protein [Clostridia bacterium]HOR90145.1 DUF951 domain-containing protein [Clostridia bacterium]HOT70407.1 DUF951 domain-containing protein [Clostridia bacterium]HPL08315.1 DUF951 domain-containing protein [Clostridia bacterium]
MKTDIQLNDIVELKKAHPCGSNKWRILRTGADFRLECLGCGHKIMLTRNDLFKKVKNVLKEDKD